MGIILQHLQTPPRPPHELRPDLGIPEPLSAVLLQSLQKDRERRFRTAGAMVAALDGVLALPLPELGGAVPFATPPPDRPVTPRSVPADIEDRETRAMPRTPPAGSPSTGAPLILSGAAVPSHSSPPPGLTLPPLPRTPPPGVTPPPTAQTIPPLPMPTLMGAYPRKRPRRRWLVWTIAGFLFWLVFVKKDNRAPRREASPSPAPSAEVAAAATADEEDSEAKDLRLRDEIQKALQESPNTRSQPITVEVDEADVTLEGKASSLAAAIEAEVLARRVPGVDDVSNKIEYPEAERPRRFPRIEVSIPPLPDFTRIVPAEAIQEMVKEGQKVLESGEPEKALHVFSAALALDPKNKDAQEGLREAGRQVRERAARDRRDARERERDQRGRHPPHPPTAPPPSPDGR
jgi:hypothetical protein